MRESCLTVSDRAFLENFRVWIRASMESQILYTPSQPHDLVFVKSNSPQPPTAGGDFVSLSELVWRCEHYAGHTLIYEAWLAEALLGAFRVARSLNEDDGKRFIAYFKSYHQIDDEAELAKEAILAVSEASKCLYGSE